MSEIFKIAQRWQRMLPGMGLTVWEKIRIVPYDGQINGEPFWKCESCGNPILDEEGKPVNDPKRIVGFGDAQTINEEVFSGYVFSQQELDSIAKVGQDYIERAYFIIHQFTNSLHTPTSLPEDVLDVQRQPERLTQPRVYKEPAWSVFAPPKLVSRLREALKELQASFQRWLVNKLYSIKYLMEERELSAVANIADLIDLFNDLSLSYDSIFMDSFSTRSVYSTIPEYNEKTKAQYERFKSLLLKNLNEKPIVLEKIIKWLKPFVGAEGVTRSTGLKQKRPLCESCYDDLAYFCQEDGCEKHSLHADEFVDVETREWDLKASKYRVTRGYYCEGVHGSKCERCGRGVRIGDGDTVARGAEGAKGSAEYYHMNCYSATFGHCDKCQREAYIEDMRMAGEGIAVCPNCYSDADREEGIASVVSTKELKAAKKLFADKRAFYPLDGPTIEKTIMPVLRAAIKHSTQGKVKYEDSVAFIVKRLPKAEARAAVEAEAAYHDNIEELSDFFIDNLDAIRQAQARHPDLKGFKLFPVEIKISSGASYHQGNTFVIYPTARFLDWAEIVMPGAKKVYDKVLSMMGHHRGALGYARFSLSDGNIIVDNLQTDIDSQSLGQHLSKNPAFAWWAAQIKKMWAPTLLDALSQFGETIGRPVYLTSFKMQKQKWSSIPARNIDVYEKIPEMMGMKREKIDAKPEDLKKNTWTMRRVAEALDRATTAFVKLTG